MINRESMEGAVIADDFEEVIYKVEDEDLYMIGTSEHAMAAMRAKEILEGKDLHYSRRLPEPRMSAMGCQLN